MGNGASICTAGKEDHIRSQMPDTIDLFVGEALVIGGNKVHDNRTRPECCTLCAFCRHGLYGTSHHHLQPTASAACGDVYVHANAFVCRYDVRSGNDHHAAVVECHFCKCIE